MSATFVDVHSRQGQVSIPTIWVAVAISLVLHTLLLWSWPALLPTELLSPADEDLPGKKQGSLAVRLASPPKPPAPPAIAPAPAPSPTPRVLTKPAPQARAAAPASSAPRVLAQERPATPPTVPAAPAPKPAASPAPSANDFAAFVEQRRRQREAQDRPAEPAPQQPAETEQDRHNREVARSLGLNRSTGLGGDRNRGGGIFQVTSLTPERASVAFYGWNKTIERKVLQTIEVSRGDQPSIEVAVVRRMIELIRAQTMGDLTWESLRLGRDVELSARPKDTQKLEAFLMEEFFWDRRQRP